MAKCLPSKYKVLNLNPNTTRKKVKMSFLSSEAGETNNRQGALSLY
jgi:hypothetical protein